MLIKTLSYTKRQLCFCVNNKENICAISLQMKIKDGTQEYVFVLH